MKNKVMRVPLEIIKQLDRLAVPSKERWDFLIAFLSKYNSRTEIELEIAKARVLELESLLKKF